MSQNKKLLNRILNGHNDSNISFSELCLILDRLGFNKRIRGDHHIYAREDVKEIINIQPRGNMAKPYQVKQVRAIINLYKIGGNDEL